MDTSSFKIIVVGARAVGKTSFIQRYVNGVFSDHYKTTIGVDFSLKVLTRSDGRRIKLYFWDISGQEYVVGMTRVYYKDAHAAIIMFDVTDTNSFGVCEMWKKDIDAKCCLKDGSPLPVMLLANKIDLQKHRTVDKETTENFVTDHKLAGWSEVSVKQNVMVNESIEFLIEELLANEAKTDTKGTPGTGQETPLRLPPAADSQQISNPRQCSC